MFPPVLDPDSNREDLYVEFFLSIEEEEWIIIDDSRYDILLKPTTRTSIGFSYIMVTLWDETDFRNYYYGVEVLPFDFDSYWNESGNKNGTE